MTIEVLALKFATIRYTLLELAQLSFPLIYKLQGSCWLNFLPLPLGSLSWPMHAYPGRSIKLKLRKYILLNFLILRTDFSSSQNHIGRCCLTCEQERTTDLFLPILNLLTIFIIMKKPYIDLLSCMQMM